MARNTKPAPEQMAEVAAAKFKPEIASSALVEAVFVGDVKAAHEYEVTPQTIRNWRARLGTDIAFSRIYEGKRQAAYDRWKDELIPGILAHIRFGREAVQQGDYSPEMVAASGDALRVLLESQFSLELLNRAGNVQQVGADATANPEALAGG